MDEFDDEGDSLLCTIDLDQLQDTKLKNSTRESNGFSDEDDNDLLLAAVDAKIPADSKQDVNYAEIPVKIPDQFPFPFEPYDIQKGFMSSLYQCLEQGRIGIFESPTGTGKSLSLICGALRWLKDFQEHQRQELELLMRDSNKENRNGASSTSAGEGELDWISDFKSKQEIEEQNQKMKEEVEHRLKKEAKLKEMRKSKKSSKRKRVQLEDDFNDLIKTADTEIKEAFKAELDSADDVDTSFDVEDDKLVLDEYDSDTGGPSSDKNNDSDEENETDAVHCTKIYFCSRTHSQLSQFVREVIKSPYGEDTRVVSLGSRQSLCVNEAVQRLKSLSLINDTCRDLQKKKSEKKTPGTKRAKTNTSKGCPYYKQDPVDDFKDAALVEVRDIEQLVTLGKQMKACPYYGTRLAIPDAEIVALPYNTLLHKSTREANGIQLKDNIVIIDEAHNLLETINNVYSTEVTGSQLLRAHSQLMQYEAKYRSRLKAQNLMYIKQILFILGNLIKCIGGNTEQHPDKQTLKNTETKLWTINDFLFHSQLDNVNMFKVVRYCQRSQIARKLHGFVEKYKPGILPAAEKETKKETATSSLSNFLQSIKAGKENKTEEVTDEASIKKEDNFVMSSPLMHIEGFLHSLTNADKDGRIVISKQKLFSQCSVKFLLLNPAVHFADVVKETRAVVVAGGTMQPISEFKEQLFHGAGVTPNRILEYSCGHVIPGEQLLPMVVSTGPTGVQLDFTFQNRNKNNLLDELGRVVCNICNVIPGGVICFFPSYEYEKQVYAHWQNSGVIEKLQTKKKVFREPKRAGLVDQVLAEYSSCIQSCCGTVTGSVLFCVVGGKMSEGINFSDDLGRCVMMVGMPYPNINSPELKEKMDYLNSNFPKDKEGRLPGQVHYENLCMKAVNQSIGRAIRHQKDYATILLLDRRYARSGTVVRLPGWISKHLIKMDKFGNVVSSVSKFFYGKKSR